MSCRLVTRVVPRWARLFLRERSSVSWERGRLKVGWLCDGALRMACTSNKQTQRIQCKHATRGRNEACCADRRIALGVIKCQLTKVTQLWLPWRNGDYGRRSGAQRRCPFDKLAPPGRPVGLVQMCRGGERTGRTRQHLGRPRDPGAACQYL